MKALLKKKGVRRAAVNASANKRGKQTGMVASPTIARTRAPHVPHLLTTQAALAHASLRRLKNNSSIDNHDVANDNVSRLDG